jgi:selenophosphate synthase
MKVFRGWWRMRGVRGKGRLRCCCGVQVAVEIDFDAVPMLDGAEAVAAAGVTSSLHSENLRAVEHMVSNPEELHKR